MSKTRLMQACAGVALAIGVANTADAGLTIDLRLTGAGDQKQIDVSSLAPGTRIPIDVYAIVTGAATGVEGFQSAQGAFIGTRNGGGPSGTIHPAGDLDQATFEVVLPALDPYTGQGAQRGASKDIGAADGIIDLGDATNRDDLGDLVVFRAPGLQVTSGTVIPNGREFKIGHLEFELGTLDDVGAAEINWVFRRAAAGGPKDEAALFRQDGANSTGSGQIASGAPIQLTIVPEPGTFGLAAMGALGLLARRRK